jgi:ribosomal protein S27AE
MIEPPLCPGCGKSTFWSLTRYGARWDCLPCKRWAWNDGPLRTKAEHEAAKRGRVPRVQDFLG